MSRARRRPHRPSCRHCPRVRLLGHEFRLWREAFDLGLEAVSAGYAAEARDHLATHQAPTFRRYLEQMAGSGWPMSGSAPASSRWAA